MLDAAASIKKKGKKMTEIEKEELEYYRKKEELHRYIREFQLQLAKDGFIALAYIDLPIQLVNGFNLDVQGFFTIRQTNYLNDDKPLPVIKIYAVDYEDLTNLKKIIRHEILHFTLWLYDIPNHDDSPEFNAFCKIYKGNAYKKLSMEQKAYCDELKKLSKEELYRKMLTGYMKCIDTDTQGNKIEVSYYDFFRDISSGISRLYINSDVQKIKYEVI